MKTVWEQRASTILFNLIRSLEAPGTFLVPANVCPIVPVTFAKAGRPFELVDIEPGTLCLDREALLGKLRKSPGRYCGALFVHTYGVAGSFDDFFAELKRLCPELLVIDDRCLCVQQFEADDEGAADVTLYSTGYSKYIELGFGGYAFLKPWVRYRRADLPFAVEDHRRLVEAMREAQVGSRPFAYRDNDWLDCREPEGSFEAYRQRVETELPAVRSHKTLLNRIYRSRIPAEVQLRPDHHQWRFNVLVPEKEKLIGSIFGHGLFASSHYPCLIEVFGRGEGRRSRELHARVVNLFNSRVFTPEQAEQVSELVCRHVDLYGWR